MKTNRNPIVISFEFFRLSSLKGGHVTKTFVHKIASRTLISDRHSVKGVNCATRQYTCVGLPDFIYVRVLGAGYDECGDWGRCDQLCGHQTESDPTSPVVCSCHSGYKLDPNGHTCIADSGKLRHKSM